MDLNMSATVISEAVMPSSSTIESITSRRVFELWRAEHSIILLNCGFVQFDSEDAAQSAIVKLNGMLINDKQVIAAYMMIDSLNKKGYNGYAIRVPSFTEIVQIFTLAAPVYLTIASKMVVSRNIRSHNYNSEMKPIC